MTKTEKPSPIEVWLTQNNMEVRCMIVREDETTRYLDVDSLSMRGAQREITSQMIADGYKPVGRWVSELQDDEGQDRETYRRFKLASEDSE